MKLNTSVIWRPKLRLHRPASLKATGKNAWTKRDESFEKARFWYPTQSILWDMVEDFSDRLTRCHEPPEGSVRFLFGREGSPLGQAHTAGAQTTTEHGRGQQKFRQHFLTACHFTEYICLCNLFVLEHYGVYSCKLQMVPLLKNGEKMWNFWWNLHVLSIFCWGCCLDIRGLVWDSWRHCMFSAGNFKWVFLFVGFYMTK